MKLHIKGGRVIDPSQSLDQVTDCWIADGKIVAIGSQPSGFEADQVLDADNAVVCPGLIDLQVNLCEPGLTQKGTVATELAAAVAGGVTTVCCLPTTSPVMDTPAVVRLVLDRAEETCLAQVLPFGALTKNLESEHLANIASLTDSGCVAISNGYASISDNQTLLRCFEYAATFDLLIHLHPNDRSLSGNGCAHEGAMSFQLGLAGIPASAEALDVARILLLAEQTGVRVHLAQLSTARAVEMVADAQQRGVRVTADVAVQNLLLTDETLSGFDSAYHVIPPLRTEEDRKGLIEGVKSGVISAVCSAHQPQEAAAKEAPFASTEPGMIGLQSLLSLGLSLVEDNQLSLTQLLESLCSGPAGLLGQDLGTLQVGAKANVCVFNPNASWQWDEVSNRSKAANSPYFGSELNGKVLYTVYAGQVVFQG